MMAKVNNNVRSENRVTFLAVIFSFPRLPFDNRQQFRWKYGGFAVTVKNQKAV